MNNMEQKGTGTIRCRTRKIKLNDDGGNLLQAQAQSPSQSPLHTQSHTPSHTHAHVTFDKRRNTPLHKEKTSPGYDYDYSSSFGFKYHGSSPSPSSPGSPDSTTLMLPDGDSGLGTSFTTFPDDSLGAFPTSPPSLSSSSSSSSLSTLDEMFRDLRFSLPSGILFFIGSILSLSLALIDLKWGDYYYSEEYYNAYGDGDGVNDDADAAEDSIIFDPYTIISIAAAVGYILNPIVDVTRCIYYKKDNPKLSWWDRDLRYDLASALLFCLAASIDLWASIPKSKSGSNLSQEDVDAQIVTATLVSCHVYLLSAIASLMGLNCGSCFKGWPFALGFIGDMLFLMGSIIDVSISYISDPTFISFDPMILLKLGILSSALWLVDSVLYLLADFIVLCWQKKYGDTNTGSGGGGGGAGCGTCPQDKRDIPTTVNIGLEGEIHRQLDNVVARLELL